MQMSSSVSILEYSYIPSTFAPPEVVEKIKAKRVAAAKVIQPRQNCSMAAKKKTVSSEMANTSPVPKVMTVLDKRITMIDEAKKIVSFDTK